MKREVISGRNVRRYHALSHARRCAARSQPCPHILRVPRPLFGAPAMGVRYLGIGILARQLLKVRYWILGGSVAGGVALKDKYNNFKQQLPDIPDFSQFFPEATADELQHMWDRMKDRAENGSGALVGFAHDRLNRANSWLLDLEKSLGSQIRNGITEGSSTAVVKTSDALVEGNVAFLTCMT